MALFQLQKNGFLSVSLEKISILDSYVIHRYIIIKYRSSSIWAKVHQLLWELRPFFNFEKWFFVGCLLKSVLDSYFIHRYVSKKYRSSSVKGKIQQLIWALCRGRTRIFFSFATIFCQFDFIFFLCHFLQL